VLNTGIQQQNYAVYVLPAAHVNAAAHVAAEQAATTIVDPTLATHATRQYLKHCTLRFDWHLFLFKVNTAAFRLCSIIVLM
jgi:hypothetical protein